jgi:HSP20 family protein
MPDDQEAEAMPNLAEQLKHGAGQAWESLSEGWRELGARASGALTRFWSGADTDLAAQPGASPGKTRPDPSHDERWPPPARWSFMAVDVYAAAEQLTVRIEAPGMKRDDFRIEMPSPEVLSVSGTKRYDREFDHGNYRLVQCAYGSFRRDIHLPTAVDVDKARANYEDGVLRIELPKRDGRGRRIELRG